MLLTSHTECLATYSAQLKGLVANVSSTTDIKRNLIGMSSSIVNDSASPLRLELDDENTYKQIIYQQFAPAAKERGYTIETNKSVLGRQHHPNVSKCSGSRPDLVIYCPTALQGCVVFQPETISEEPEEVTLRGSLTENKKDGSTDDEIVIYGL